MTTQREAELRQRDLLHYTDSLMSDVKTLARKQSTYDHLAAFILNNYAGVFENQHSRFQDVFEGLQN